MRPNIAILFLSALTLVIGCAKTEAPGQEACADKHESAAACGEVVSGAALTAEPTTRVDANGTNVQQVGAPLTGVEPMPIADLIAKAEELKGRPVRIAGHVAAMCHHKRGWFALANDEPNSPYVRVLTAPTFLVPEGVIGKRALAEGVVETIEVSAAAAQHFAGEHKLGGTAPATAPVKQVVLRASGAEFM